MLNIHVEETPLPGFTFHILVVSPDDGRNIDSAVTLCPRSPTSAVISSANTEDLARDQVKKVGDQQAAILQEVLHCHCRMSSSVSM